MYTKLTTAALAAAVFLGGQEPGWAQNTSYATGAAATGRAATAQDYYAAATQPVADIGAGQAYYAAAAQNHHPEARLASATQPPAPPAAGTGASVFADDPTAGYPLAEYGTATPVCATCNAAHCGCPNFWQHRSGLFGEFLYLSPRGFDVAYAEQINGPVNSVNTGIQTGRVANVGMAYNAGFRTGFNYALNPAASIVAGYTYFDNAESDGIARAGTNEIQPLIVHPLAPNAGDNYTSANARQEVQFQLADISYRWLWRRGARHAINLTVGARYGHLEQDLDARFNGNTFRTVNSDVNFDGGGLRLGIDFQRFATTRGGLFVYGKSYANFLAGTFRGHYRQGSLFDPTEVNATWSDQRIVTLLEMELGVGWQSRSGNWRINGGYMVNAWFNSLSNDTFINAVQNSNFANVQETLAFDGFVGRVTYRF